MRTTNNVEIAAGRPSVWRIFVCVTWRAISVARVSAVHEICVGLSQ